MFIFFFNEKEFGAKLKMLRLAHGLIQSDLGKVIGVSATQISDIEKGKSTPSLQRAVELSKFFSVSLDYLVGLEPLVPNAPSKLPALLSRVDELPDDVKLKLEGYLDALGC